jgi:hypothetical protein
MHSYISVTIQNQKSPAKRFASAAWVEFPCRCTAKSLGNLGHLSTIQSVFGSQIHKRLRHLHACMAVTGKKGKDTPRHNRKYRYQNQNCL